MASASVEVSPEHELLAPTLWRSQTLSETYEAVRRAPPGHVLVLKGTSRRLYLYWDPVPTPGSEDWVRDVVVRSAPPKARAGIRDVALVQDAAFAHYARGASDDPP